MFGSHRPSNRDEWTAAWEDRYLRGSQSRDRGVWLRRAAPGRLARRLGHTRAAVIALSITAMGVPAIVVAAGEGGPLRLGERNPSSGGSSRETAVVANVGNSGLVMRPSNTAKGGRAISATCDNDGLVAEDGCAVYVNKGQGAAASFRTQGSVPFAVRETNNGTVQHLNADMVDGKHASELQGAQGPQGPAGPQGPQGPPGPQGEPATRLWGSVDSVGIPRGGSGVIDAQKTSTGVYDVIFDRDISACARLITTGFPISGGSALTANTTFYTQVMTNDTVTVRSRAASSNTPADTAFHIALFC